MGAGGAAGQPGGDSWFGNPSTVFAQGGDGGNDAGAGAGGSANIGNEVIFPGGSGGDGATTGAAGNRMGGGGGGSATSTAPGEDGTDGGNNAGGEGGAGEGPGGDGDKGGNDGRPGGVPGGGGGGGGHNAVGGPGGDGRVIITYNALAETAGITDDPPNLASGWTLEPGSVMTITFDVTVNDPATVHEIVNTASVTSAQQPDPASDSDVVMVSKVFADLGISKSVDITSPAEGETVAYTLTLVNWGPEDAEQIVVEDPLSEGLTYAGHSASRGNYDPASGLWTVDTLSAGDHALLEIQDVVDSGTLGTTITNTARITAGQPPDPNPHNDEASAIIHVSSLRLEKISDAPGAVHPGEVITYTLLITNTAGPTHTGVAVIEEIPAGATYVPGSVEGHRIPEPTGMTNNVRDEFNAVAWTNNDGSVSWSTPWNEINDDGNPSTGSVTVQNDTTGAPPQMRLTRSGRGAWRAVDLSGYETAILSLDYRRENIRNGNYAALDISTDAGASWVELTRFEAGADTTYSAFTTDISDHITDDVRIRVRLCDSSGPQEKIWFDNVDIAFAATDGAGTIGDPPNVASGWSLEPGHVLWVTFNVQVDDPCEETHIVNTAIVTSDQQPIPITASVTNPVVPPGMPPELNEFVIHDADTITDAQANSGGYLITGIAHEPVGGLAADGGAGPRYRIKNPVGVEVVPLTYFTNAFAHGTTKPVTLSDAVPDYPYDDIVLGTHTAYVYAASAADPDLTAMLTIAFVVFDDDVTPPTAPSNVVVTPAGWTNVNAFTVEWEAAVDPPDPDTGVSSGIHEYRVVIGGPAPTNVTDGFSVGLETSVLVTNAPRGITTNWIFAVDADDDRPGDRLKGPNASFITRFDDVPPGIITNVSAEPLPASHSRVRMTWDPLPDGGGLDGDPLSPWKSYVIFYTDQDRDPYFGDPMIWSENGYPSLGNIHMSTVDLSGFAHGVPYRLAVAGLDEAGNLGPLSASVMVHPPELRMTRGTTVGGNPKVEFSWTALPGAEYDLIAVDAEGFSVDLTNQWQLVASGMTNTLTDTNPVPPGILRFYRVAPKDKWQPEQSPRVASREIYVAQTIELEPDINWIQWPGTPDIDTVTGTFGSCPFPARTTPAEAVTILWYDRSAAPMNVTHEVWLACGEETNTWFTVPDNEPADDMAVPPEDGVLIRIPESLGPGPHRFLFVGRIPTNAFSQVIVGGETGPDDWGTANLVPFRLPTPVHPGELNLIESGFTGGTDMESSDGVFVYNPQEGRRHDIYWHNTADQKWYDRDNNILPDNVKPLIPDRAIGILRRPDRPDYTWTRPIPYPVPTHDMNP